MNKELISKSRYISKLLRHDPENLKMDKEGWVLIQDLIKKVGISRILLDAIVETNDKKRFELDQYKTKIRACQGHSIEVNLDLESVKPPEILYHGTSTRFVDSIFKEGLKKMNRQHVHLSNNLETAYKVGQRHGSPIVLLIKAKEMADYGYQFYISNNGVWLTEEVPVKYIERNNNG